MKILFATVAALLLSACALTQGTPGEFVTTDTVQLENAPDSFTTGAIAVAEQLGYDYVGGDRARNVVRLKDVPNLGEHLLSKNYSVNMTLTLLPDGRTVQIDFIGIGGRVSASAAASEERIEAMKIALQNQFS